MRIPMFFKFLAGCMLLASTLIVGGALVFHEGTKMKSRGNYLQKHFKRYLEYQAGLGKAVSSVADTVANDPRLIAALTMSDQGTADIASAQAISKSLFSVLSRKNAIRPDLFLLFDSKGLLVWANSTSIVDSEDLRELEPTARVLNGTAFFNKILIHKDHALQLAGVPVQDDDGQVIGGVLLGVRVLEYMEDYMRQSDDSVAMQHRLVLVHSGTVIESVMPKEIWPELEKKLKPDEWSEVPEGDIMRPVIRLKDGDKDFYHGTVEGFAGLSAGEVAELYLLRSRVNLQDRSAVIPWRDITVGIILSVLIATLMASWITRPIKRFVKQSQALLEGGADLSQRIEINTNDETKDLADNINRVFARLYTLACEVQNAAFQVGASSAQISAASKQMLSGLQDQTYKIESSTAAVTELSASIQQVADNAAEATKAAEKSNTAVSAAVERMAQIRSSVEDAADKMSELGESSKRIGNIVEVIRQISEQTSMLALNASIEAAHAGEHGRGFAVVADEVSSLARRVGQSAKDIERLIQTIREQTSEAVSSMEHGSQKVESGTELVTNTLQDLQQLIHVVKDTAAAVQEQALVSDEIARNMDAVQQIAAEMLVGSEEAVQQGEQLHGLAFGLEQSVGGFNIDSHKSDDRPALPERTS